MSRRRITFGPAKEGHDHVDAYFAGEWIGWRSLESDQIRLQRCPMCDRENYVLAVLSGVCCWCNWSPNEIEETADAGI